MIGIEAFVIAQFKSPVVDEILTFWVDGNVTSPEIVKSAFVIFTSKSPVCVIGIEAFVTLTFISPGFVIITSGTPTIETAPSIVAVRSPPTVISAFVMFALTELVQSSSPDAIFLFHLQCFIYSFYCIVY